MLFIKSYIKLQLVLISNLTTLIDKKLSKLSKKRKKISLNYNYEKCLFITSNSNLKNKKKKNKGFLSGPTLVIQSIKRALNIVSDEILIEDWNNKRFISFLKNSRNYNDKKSLICGITCPKLLFAKILNPKSHFVLILMNANNAYRLEQINKSLNHYKVGVIKEEIPSPPFLQSLLIFFADKVLLVGNTHTLSSYINKGWEKSLFQISNAQIDSSFFNTKSRKLDYKNHNQYCFPASLHGHRKGLFYTISSWIEFFIEIKKINKNLPILVMTGKLPKVYDNFLKKKFGYDYKKNFNIQNKGWVSEKELKEIYFNSKFIIATPLEEGQVAAVLEAIACGANPIISKDTGISFKKYLYINNSDNGEKNSLFNALINTYFEGEFKNKDNFLLEKNRKKFIYYYEKDAVYYSLISIFR